MYLSLACSLRQHQLCADADATPEDDTGCDCECHLVRRIEQAKERADSTLERIQRERGNMK